MTDENQRLNRSIPFGLALLTGATLLLEITLTRIFSVTMWYHYAFMAVSVAMFGMAFGAVLVYLKPQWFPHDKLGSRLATLSLTFALGIVVAFWMHLQIPFIPAMTLVGIASVVVTFTLVTLPFMLSGVAVSLVLTRFPRHVGKLYAFDLIGAAIGCLALWALIRDLTGPGVVLFCAAAASFSGLLFAWSSNARRIKRATAVFAGLFLVMAVLQPYVKFYGVKYVKNAWGGPMAQKVDVLPLVEMWNSHSVITVFNTPDNSVLGWGMSPTYQADGSIPKQLFMLIDAAAATVITQFDGNFRKVRHLKYDITSLAHHLNPEKDVLVIGVGGGRDVLTALSFNPKSVTGVEINSAILQLITEDIESFTHLGEQKHVRYIHDEARSWVERSDERFGIIQASLIDSWAATSAGAFVLTENSLYTEEAWTAFLEHLTDDGMLTMSRWWVRDQPGEMMRAASLAYAALRNLGAENPRDHVLIATTDFEQIENNPNGVGTIIVSRKPLTQEMIQRFQDVCATMKFRLLLSPDHSDYPEFVEILNPATHDQIVSSYKLNIVPPTDDSPFFFNMLRFKDVLFGEARVDNVTGFNIRAVSILFVLFVMVSLMSALGLLLPLWIHERARRKAGQSPLPRAATARHALYFAAIGLGFILVEIGQIQRLTLFLGHPVYSLTVVLFSLLLATGIGSYLCGRVVLDRADSAGRIRLVIGLLLAVSVGTALGIPPLLGLFDQAGMTPRLLISITVLFAMGVPMGMAFPVGLSLADKELPRATPWLWAINGALSVVGSVAAVILSIAWGITATCAIGAACYLLAWALMNMTLRRV
jgi:hypothetical protein